MPDDPKARDKDRDASLSPAEVAQVNETIRHSRVGLASDKRIIAEGRRVVEASKKLLARRAVTI